jgi:hypothetical protein
MHDGMLMPTRGVGIGADAHEAVMMLAAAGVRALFALQHVGAIADGLAIRRQNGRKSLDCLLPHHEMTRNVLAQHRVG